MTSPILVTGGTGTLGRLVVARLRDTGCAARVLSRHCREAEDGIEFVTGDLATGKGIEAAVDGAGTIVHCAGSPKGGEDKARNLVRAASRAGTAHLVHISVVGADRIPIVSRVDRAMFGYFGSKLAVQPAIESTKLIGVPPLSPFAPCIDLRALLNEFGRRGVGPCRDDGCVTVCVSIDLGRVRARPC